MSENATASSGRNYWKIGTVALLTVLMVSLFAWAATAPAGSCLQCGIRPAVVQVPPPVVERVPVPVVTAVAAAPVMVPPPVEPLVSIDEKMQPAPPPITSEKNSCDGQLSWIIMQTTAATSEFMVPFASPAGGNITQLKLDPGQKQVVSLPTCQNIHRNFWMAFSADFEPAEDQLAVHLYVGDDVYAEGRDFDLIACSTPQCELGSSDINDNRTYYAVRWLR